MYEKSRVFQKFTMNMRFETTNGHEWTRMNTNGKRRLLIGPLSCLSCASMSMNPAGVLGFSCAGAAKNLRHEHVAGIYDALNWISANPHALAGHNEA